MTLMEIIDFEPRFAGAFFALNEAWVSRHFVMEARDREVLGDPQGAIIDKGGFVFIAIHGDDAVGCCALMSMADSGFEIAKMAVSDRFKGKGIGKALMAACIARARSVGAPRLYLESGSILTPALTLYRSFGFQDLPSERRPVSPYARADVWMELML